MAKLSKGIRWDTFNLHIGIDPGCGEIEPPSASECRRFNIRVTRFSPNRNETLAGLNQSNVYFAPRSAEGIGMAFLEAMARGQCVVSPDSPTMSEYIDHNISGLLYDLNDSETVEFSSRAEPGAAARLRIENGYHDWTTTGYTSMPALPSNGSVIRQRGHAKMGLRTALGLKRPDADKGMEDCPFTENGWFSTMIASDG